MRPISFQTFIIDTIEAWQELVDYVNSEPFEVLSLDVETDSAQEKTAHLYGIGLSFKAGQAFYIPIRKQDTTSWWTEDEELSIANTINEWAITSKLIGHNIIYDVLVLENNWGLDFTPYIYSDTILQKHTLNEERPFGLKEVAVQYLGEWANKAQEALKENVLVHDGRWTKEQKDMYKADTHILADYCCFDVCLTRALFDIFEPRIHAEGFTKFFYEEEVMPLYKEVTIPMKRRGFPVDVGHFQQLDKDLARELKSLHTNIMDLIQEEVVIFEQRVLDKQAPAKTGGTFPKALAKVLNIKLPRNRKTNKVTLSKKDISLRHSLAPNDTDEYAFFDWLLGNRDILDVTTEDKIRLAQKAIYFDKKVNEGKEYIFNIASNDHLGWLFFEHYGMIPLSYTEHNKPQCDEEFLEEACGQELWVKQLIDWKKLYKLKSTYVEGILEKQIDGRIYTSMLQFGTTSGRYSSRQPNLQNQPRLKEDDAGLSALVLKYANEIRRGFIAESGYKIVNADYQQLEVVCFAHMSNSESLRNVIRNGEDVYSRVAIDVNKITQYSADKKAKNFLKIHDPELRQLWKIPVLGIPYGMEASRLKDTIGGSYQEAQKIINDYLSTYPELREYMADCNMQAERLGAVKTMFGRVRHLPIAKELYEKYGPDLLDYKWADARDLKLERWQLKNALNNAKNMPIQGLAAHIVNRAMIAIARDFKEAKLDAYIGLTVHDEITCISKQSQAERVGKILKYRMENSVKLSVPLRTDPIIGNNWAESK